MLDNRKKPQYNVNRIGDSARCARRGSRNAEEAKIVGLHHPLAVKVGVGVLFLADQIAMRSIKTPLIGESTVQEH